MTEPSCGKSITLYIDADACPVKQEVYRVAERHARKGAALKVLVVSNSPIAVPRDEMIERVVVGAGMDEADHWIAERARAGDIVITADVPLASRCVKAGAEVIAPNGRRFTKDFDRHDAGDPQPDGFAAQRRRDHQRPEAVHAARPLQLPRRARPGHRAADARRVRASGGLGARAIPLPLVGSGGPGIDPSGITTGVPGAWLKRDRRRG